MYCPSTNRESPVSWSSGFGYRVNKSGQHSFDLTDPWLQDIKLLRRKKSQVSCQQKKVFKFASRAEGDVKKLAQLGVCPSITTFGDVRGNEGSCPAPLAGKAKELLLQKYGCDVVHAHRECMAFLLDLQLSVILRGGCFAINYNYLLLTDKGKLSTHEGGIHVE